jgi:hypothetical protein
MIFTVMPIQFPGISATLCTQLESAMRDSKSPLSTTESAVVHRMTDGIVVRHDTGHVFAKYSWYPRCENDVELFRTMLGDETLWRYMPVVYETSSNDPTIPDRIVETFRERFGPAKFGDACDKIQWMTFDERGKNLVIVLLPHEIVRSMLSADGGRLMTVFRGSAAELRKIPLLVSQVPESTADSEVVRRVFATQYGPGKYHEAQKIHWDLVRSTICDGVTGISVGPVAAWMP